MVDNFLDLAHFPFTHLGTFGDPDDIEVPAVLRRARRAGVHVRLRPLDEAARRLDGRRAFEVGAAPLDVVVRRAVRDPAAHRLPGRRRRADDPVLPPAGRRHHHQAVLLRPAQRHRRRTHHGRGHGGVPAGRRRGGPGAARADRVEGRAARRPGRGAHPRRPDHARDAPGPARPRARRPRRPRRDAAPSPVRRRGDRAARGSPPLAGVRRRARAVDRRRAGRLGERHGRHAGRGDRPDRRRRPATCTGGRRGPRCGRRPAACSSAATLAFVAALLTATVPPLRRAITRLAAIANAAPWVAVAPCLLVVLGRDRGPDGGRRARRVLLRVRRRPPSGSSAAPRSAHDVLTALGAPPLGPGARRAAARRAGRRSLDGLKLAAPAALAGAIFGEWYGAERGLGVLLHQRRCRAAAPSGCGPRRCSARRAGSSRSRCFALVAPRRWSSRYGIVDRADRRAGGRRPAPGADGALVELVTAVAHRRRAGRRSGGRGSSSPTSRRSSCPARRGCGTTSSTRRATTSSADRRHAAHGGDRPRARRRRRRRRRRRSPSRTPAPRRRRRADRRRAGGHAARRPAPAVRPGLRLRAVDGARSSPR